MHQLPQNLARVHILVHSCDINHENIKIFILPIVSVVLYCPSIVHVLF